MATRTPGTAPRNLFGEFLRARRGLVTPVEAGLPDVRGRRVSGLRREEVALLAGVSTDYYTRLEQGGSGTPPRRSCTRSPARCGSTRPPLRICSASPCRPSSPAPPPPAR